ncbi:MAG: pseudaminic acid cytidylyltransferase [Bacteroidia bacterium]|nr:pseudaminic acid cytidylyltransferase [Bacteroidia bacterium]
MKKSAIAIIPARGGSKRIPKKNIKNFLGKPIIAYSIQAALESNLFDEVMVSTDDMEIAKIAIQYGAQVPFIRSNENSDDYATTMDVIDEVLKKYLEKQEKKFQFACCVYPTAPLIQINQLEEGLSILKKNNFTCVFPAVAFSYPLWRGLEISENGETKMVWPEYLNSRSQDLKKVYHDAGQWYWFNTDNLKAWVWPDNTGSIILSEESVQDIDSITDWKLAEMKYKLLLEK